MTVEEFKILAASFFDEDLSYWESNGQDLLLLFINLARKVAANQNDFFSMQRRLITTVTSDGANFNTDFYEVGATEDDDIVRKVKMVTDVYTYTRSGSVITYTGVLDYKPQSEADRILKMQGHSTFHVFYPEGRKLRAQGITVPSSIAVRAVIYPETLTAADNNTEDYFLDVGQNWMLQKVLGLMNMKVKEDMRLGLSKRIEDQAWREFVNADASVGDNATDFTNLT